MQLFALAWQRSNFVRTEHTWPCRQVISSCCKTEPFERAKGSCRTATDEFLPLFKGNVGAPIRREAKHVLCQILDSGSRLPARCSVCYHCYHEAPRVFAV